MRAETLEVLSSSSYKQKHTKETLAADTVRYRGKMFGTSRLNVSLKTTVPYVADMTTNRGFVYIAVVHSTCRSSFWSDYSGPQY
jgi:hypothetical protein